jgi:hypothetical protein
MSFVIMHPRFMDVAFRVHRITYQDSKRKKVKGHWINLGYSGKPYALFPNMTTLVIRDWPIWLRLTDEQVNTPRLQSGVPK